VADEVGGKELIKEGDVPLVPAFFGYAAIDGFVLFGGHRRDSFLLAYEALD
jgi:hypothetical protein